METGQASVVLSSIHWLALSTGIDVPLEQPYAHASMLHDTSIMFFRVRSQSLRFSGHLQHLLLCFGQVQAQG